MSHMFCDLALSVYVLQGFAGLRGFKGDKVRGVEVLEWLEVVLNDIMAYDYMLG